MTLRTFAVLATGAAIGMAVADATWRVLGETANDVSNTIDGAVGTVTQGWRR